MNITKRLTGFSLVLVAAGVLSMPFAAIGQDSAVKRKVNHRVLPEYPNIARQMNITGKVKIEATVEPDGHVKSTRPLGGSPLLVEAASRALKDWKFESGPKETTEIVEFDFNGQDSN